MEEVSPVVTAAPESVGEVLRAARERQGVDLNDIAARTRIPLRHLEAIETGHYDGLPSPTYASGFVKAYARTVGLDEAALSRRVREELASSSPRAPEYQPYEAPDPARVPSRGLAIAALGVVLAIVILSGLWYGGMLNRGGTPTVAAPAPVAIAPDATGGIPAPVPSAAPSPAPTPAVTPAATPVATGGQVALQTTDRVWLRVHDGDRTLYIGTMNPGERFDVPADAQNPLVDVGRPDKLKVTLNGSTLPALPASDRPMKDLRIGAAAVAARLAGQVAPLANPTPAPTGAPGPAATPGATPPAAAPRRGRVVPRPRRAAPRDETARANLDAAHNPPPAAPQ